MSRSPSGLRGGARESVSGGRELFLRNFFDEKRDEAFLARFPYSVQEKL